MKSRQFDVQCRRFRPAVMPRCLALVLIAVLTFPVTGVMQPAGATPHFLGVTTAAATQPPALGSVRAQRKKKRNKPTTDNPPTGNHTRTVRQVLTRTFTNSTSIAIPGSGTGAATGSPADPYPSVIDVTGISNGRILDVNVTLHGLSHTCPDDIDILLSAAHLPRQNAIVLSDLGGDDLVSNINLTLDDEAEAFLRNSQAPGSGTFQPANFEDNAGDSLDPFPAPAPQPIGNVFLSVFDDSNPNGSWQLFVVDDADTDVGSIVDGWSLEITAEVDVQVEEAGKSTNDNQSTKHKKSGKKGKGRH